MALDYHTAQEDFTFIVEKLPPMFLANFVMWLDLKVAEYKVFGQMVLDDRKKNSNTRYKNLNRRPGIFNINNPEVHTTNNTNTGDHQTVKTHRASSFTNSRKLGKINTGQKMLQRHVVTHFIPDNSHSVPQTVDSGSPKMRLELQKSFPADTESLKSPPINKHVASSSWSLSNPKSVTSANALEVNHTYNGSEQMPVSLGDESLVLKVEPDFKDQTSCMMEVGQGCENQGDITPVFISDESVTGAINSWNEVDLKQVEEKVWGKGESSQPDQPRKDSVTTEKHGSTTKVQQTTASVMLEHTEHIISTHSQPQGFESTDMKAVTKSGTSEGCQKSRFRPLGEILTNEMKQSIVSVPDNQSWLSAEQIRALTENAVNLENSTSANNMTFIESTHQQQSIDDNGKNLSVLFREIDESNAVNNTMSLFSSAGSTLGTPNMSMAQSSTLGTPNVSVVQSSTPNMLMAQSSSLGTPNMTLPQSSTFGTPNVSMVQSSTPNMSMAQSSSLGTPNVSIAQASTLGTPNMTLAQSSEVKLEEGLYCPLCPEVFMDNSQWLHHHKLAHGSMCSSCQRVFKSWKSLRIHVMTAHKPQTTGYFCKFCGKRFTQQHHYRGHMKLHNGIKEFRCQHCNQAFTYRSGLTVHMRKCGGLVGDYKCPMCQKDFLKQCHLREHISGMHSDTPRYTCKSCGEKFLWRDALSRHRAKTCHN